MTAGSGGLRRPSRHTTRARKACPGPSYARDRAIAGRPRFPVGIAIPGAGEVGSLRCRQPAFCLSGPFAAPPPLGENDMEAFKGKWEKFILGLRSQEEAGLRGT
jgi:hypothetical protein